MASKSMFIFICITFLVVFCFVLMKEASDCYAGGQKYGCFIADETAGFLAAKSHNRKVLSGLKEQKEVIIDGTRMRKSDASSGNGDNKVNGWELRKVPSGPDPLHHNGNSPKKPRSP